jgi:cytochrome c biogenesis protein CcdA
MSTFVSAALALGVLASFLLIGFGLFGLMRATLAPKRGWLMITAGVITLLNVMMMAPLRGP